MKRKIKILLFLLLSVSVLSGAAGLLNAYGEEESSWQVDGGNVSTEEEYSVLTGQESIFGTDNILTAVYAQAVDFEAGAEFSYFLEDEDCFSIGDEVLLFNDKGMLIDNARKYDHSYIKFTVLNAAGEGFEVAFYHQWSDFDQKENRVEINLTYLSPNIVADEEQDKIAGRHYSETVFDCGKNFGEWHTFSAYREGEVFYIRAGDFTFAPVREYGKFDLTQATLTVTAKSMEIAPRILIRRDAEVSVRSSYGEWGTLGGSEWKNNQDGTYSVQITDRSDLVSGSTLFLRERIFNTAGYDVTQPIVLECSYDFETIIAPWWGVGLASDPYAVASKKKYKAMGTGNLSESGENADVLAERGGINIQPWARKIQRANSDPELVSYTSNSSGLYQSEENLDKVRWEIGENATTVYFNEKKIFELELKRSDFPDGKAYPFFQFIEMPPNPYQYNQITIRGVNAPALSTGGKVVKLSDAKDSRLETELQTDERELSVMEGGKFVSEEYYSYDRQTGLFEIRKEYFTDKEFGLYEFYISNGGGVCYLPVRYHSKDDVMLPPVLDADILEYRMGTGRNLSFTADMNAFSFSRVYGAGMYLADSMYDERTQKVILKSSFLSTLGRGEYQLYVESVDEDGYLYATPITLRVIKMIEVEVPEQVTILTAGECVLIAAGGIVVAAGLAAGIFGWIRHKKIKRGKKDVQ